MLDPTNPPRMNAMSKLGPGEQIFVTCVLCCLTVGALVVAFLVGVVLSVQ